MPQGAPGLWRAVADCTQPQGPALPGGASARALQKYLGDDKCVDAVYRTLIARACIEPQSEAVISKCVALLKQHLHRYIPSIEVLLELEACCQRLAASLQTHNAGLYKSLVFMQTNVARLAGDDPAMRARADGSRPGSAQASPHGSFSSAAGPTSNGEAAAAVSLLGSRTAVTSISEEPNGGRYASSHMLQESADFSRSSSEAGLLGLEQSGVQSSRQALLVPSEGTPDWALHPAALLHAGHEGKHAPDGGDWAALLPEYQPSLVPLLAESFAGLGAEELMSSQDVVDDLTDAGPEAIVQQIRDIAAMRRLQNGCTPEALHQSRNHRSSARLLFHHQPYTQQEPLPLSETDVAAALEVVCGRRTNTALSAVSGRVGDDEAAAQQRYWQAPAAGARDSRECLGQVAASVLMKLLLDMWLGVWPELALPLALRMLQQALHQQEPALRARAFDIIYNLSLHSCLLSELPGGWDAQHAATAAQQRGPHVNRGSGESMQQIASPRAQQSGGLSALPSPHIHLPQQILQAPTSPRASFTAAAGGSYPTTSGSHPTVSATAGAAVLPSPQSPLSRLSRGDRTSGFSPELSPTRRSAGAAAFGLAALGSADQLEEEGQQRGQEQQGEEGKEAQLAQWLRRLLFELLQMLAQLDERSEEVWRSALGCLLHLTTHAGHWVQEHVQDIPPAAISALLRACLSFHWSPELHSQLILLACTLLSPGEASQQQNTSHSQQQQQHQQQQQQQQQQQAEASSSGSIEHGVLRERLAAFGGLPEVLHHFCRAPSPACERCLLLVLIRGHLPPDTPAAAEDALLSAICSHPACVAALRSTLYIGQPGLADAIIASAVQAGTQAELPLLSTTLLALEKLAVAARRGAADAPGCSEEMVPAMAATIRHLRGEPLQDGTSAAAAWRALRELCWCREGVAQEWARRWLQQLLQSALEQSAKGVIALPLPAAVQRSDSPVHAATSALSETLNHIVGSCPEGAERLVEALELLIATTKRRAQQQAANGDAARVTASAAKLALQAWAFVVQWVLHGSQASCRAPLARLANLALAMTGASTAMLAAYEDQPSADGEDALPPLASSQQSLEAFRGDGHGHEGEAAGCGFVAVEEPELVGFAQAFLLGHACIHQSVAQALPGQSLISLVGRTALSQPGQGAATRGFTGRPLGTAAAWDANGCSQPLTLAPWSDVESDAQLSLLLLVIGLCHQDAASFVELGVEALAQQVLSSCLDVRQCYYMSVFLLRHLMQNQQERYWRALRHLFLQAQQLNDERLLQNPFLQVGVLLGMQ